MHILSMQAAYSSAVFTLLIVGAGTSAQRSVAPGQPIQRPDAMLLIAEEVFTATLVAVEDGDTVRLGNGISRLRTARAQKDGLSAIEDALSHLSIELYGVDAPELSEPFGQDAKGLLEAHVGKKVTVRLRGRPREERATAGRVEVGGADLSQLLLRSGFARRCATISDDVPLVRAEKQARDARRGIWQPPQATAAPTRQCR
jgi:endonuclease YncB( thermonuclease family)